MTKKKARQTEEKKPVRLAGIRRVRASFDIAQNTNENSRHWLNADSLSADAEAKHDVRVVIRNRARYEIANNSYARGLVLMLANDTVGTGPRLQLMLDDDNENDLIETEFAKWAREQKLSEKLRLMRMARCQDGETFAVIGTNPKMRNVVKMKLDVIEADRIEGDANGMYLYKDSDNDIDGIKYDEYGNPVSYRILKYHPGDDNATEEAEDVPAEYVIHTFKQTRPGQHRGVSELSSSLPLFAQLRRLNLASLSAAEAAADFSAILYTDNPPDGETDPVVPLDSIQLERNMMLTVPAGWKMGQLDGKQPTANHAEFVKSILMEISRSVCATYGIVSGDYSGFNYASGRLDNQVYQKSIIVDRDQWELDVLDPIFRAWLREWSIANRHKVDEDVPHTWFWDGFLHADPTKEANAQDTCLTNNTTTLAAIYAKQGKDWRNEQIQRAKEIAFQKQLGIISEEKEVEDGTGEDGQDE